MGVRIILLLLFIACLIYILFVFNKLRWERIILKRQMSLGTINIEESKGTYFKLGSVTTLLIITISLLVNPNIETLSPNYHEEFTLDTPNMGIIKVHGESTVYEFDNFNELINSRKVTDVVYGTIVSKEVTEKFTYMNVEVISSTNKLSTIKVFQENQNIKLEVGGDYLMILTYSENLDYYGGVGDNQGFFKEVNGYFEPVIPNMFSDIPKANLMKDVFTKDIFTLIDKHS